MQEIQPNTNHQYLSEYSLEIRRAFTLPLSQAVRKRFTLAKHLRAVGLQPLAATDYNPTIQDPR